MSDEDIEMSDRETPGEIAEESGGKRRLFRRRNVLTVLGVALASLLIVFAVAYLMFRGGIFDRYIKDQLVSKMSDMGIAFSSDVFRVQTSPLTLELQNATFTDKVTGEKLFFIRDLNMGLTVLDLLSWKLSRDIRIDTLDIAGAEVWINFDQNGRSNFSNITLLQAQPGAAIDFRYDSTSVSIQDSVVHFGALSRSIAGDAQNITLIASPAAETTQGGHRFAFDLYSKDSNFKYQDKSIEKIDVHATGTVDTDGAEIASLDLRTPIGDSSLSGTIMNWTAPTYAMDIDSTLDLTQLSDIFQNGTSLQGVGNFKGRLTGSGENYQIEGTADSEAVRAYGVYLKGVNIAGTVAGTNANYTSNGKAVAEMLTFNDFQIDFPKLTGNVRGNGTDFRWVGELEAIALKSPTMSLGGLFLSDAVAEYEDRQFRAQAGNGRVHRFAAGDTEFDDLHASDVHFSMPNGGLYFSAPNAATRSFVAKDYRVDGVTGKNVRVTNANGKTTVETGNVRSETANVQGTRANGVSARDFHLDHRHGSTQLSADDVRVDQLNNSGTRVDGLESPLVTVDDTGDTTVVYADKLRVAKIDSGSAVLGTLNIAGVRMTIRSGTIEAHSADIDAGNVTLTKSSKLPSGGDLDAVKFAQPVYVIEPSGRYRASADMSIGGGTIGSVALGAATAKVEINNERALLDDLNATVMDGQVKGSAEIAFNDRSQSRIDADLTDIDLSKLTALQSGRVIPIEGKTNGSAHLVFAGTDYRTASGKLDLSIAANAGSADRGLIPVNGRIDLTADHGLFTVTTAKLNTTNSEFDASGRFDLSHDASDLQVGLRSTDAGEVHRVMQVTDIAPDIEQQFQSLQMEFGGSLQFDGTVTGNLYDPDVDGKASLAALLLRGRTVGSVTTDIALSPAGTELRNGVLHDPSGGLAQFDAVFPKGGSNNTSITAKLQGINAGNLLAALPITLPDRIQDLNGQTSGTVDIRGLPNQAAGSIDLSAAKGTIAGQNFDTLTAKAVFQGTQITLESGEIHLGDGSATAKGKYDRQNSDFEFDLTGTRVPLPLLVAFFPKSDSIPAIDGTVDLTANTSGNANKPSTIKVAFNGIAHSVTIGEGPFGDVTFKGTTADAVLTADLTANLNGQLQIISGTLDLGKDELPLTVSTQFDQSPLGPYLAFVPQLKGLPISGTGTGRIEYSGTLRHLNAQGTWEFDRSNLSGTAQFTQLALIIQDTPLAAIEPISIKFNSREVDFISAKFAGGGSNVTIQGTKALADEAINDLDVNGRINLSLLNLIKTDVFFGGLADVAMSLTGPNTEPRLTGTATTDNASVAAFIGADRLTFERLKTRVIFTTNQAEVEEASGYLGGGKFNGTGGALLNGLAIQSFRFTAAGTDVTVPLPQDFLTTGDANLEVSGIRRGTRDNLQITIGGHIFARRSLYTKDIELSDVFGVRRETSLSSGSSSISPPRFDLTVEGRNALIVRNNIADLTASVSLTVTGDADNPRLLGRITATNGTLLYRKDRYDIQRGVLEFPPDTTIEPNVNLQAESEIAGYQIFVDLNGPLNDTERLVANVRSSPALPSDDVVSLITTGNLSNTAGGIPTLAQTGINTAAEILTDSIINNPARRATDKLFGLNVFEIDPIISGQQLNPSARLTVGRQINNNLRVTYSTNLSQDQNQVAALEYRVSNKLSFVAQYEQRALSNVTRNRDNFSFEIRFRKRF